MNTNKNLPTCTSTFKTLPGFSSRFLGFDDLFDVLDRFAYEKAPSYPPYNIIKKQDDYQIIIAIAGFSKDEIVIEKRKNELVVFSIKPANENSQDNVVYLHRGIAKREFELKFKLADNVEVLGAKQENGLLIIDLKHIIPEEDKPKQIPIAG